MSVLYKRLVSCDEFSPIGMTPPKGRQGHSVPAPIALSKDPLGSNGHGNSLNISCRDDLRNSDENDDPLSRSVGKQRRKDSPGRPLTPLDKILSRHDCVSPLETLEEIPEGGCDPIASYLSQFEDKVLIDTEHLAGEGMLSVSYGQNGVSATAPTDNLTGSFVRAFSQSMNLSLNVPFMDQMMDSSGVFPTASRAPNKALFTISAKTSRILVVNKFACEVFDYHQSELVDVKIQTLFSEPYQSKQRALVEQHINSTGETVLLSGKVMEAVRSDGKEFPVSVWMKGVKTEDEPRVIVVIEPVARANAHFAVDPRTKQILSCDDNFATLFGYLEPEELVGKRINDFIPSVVVPEVIGGEEDVEQQLTGRSKANTVFPLTALFSVREVSPSDTTDDHVPVILEGILIVYSMLSGMISFLPNGKVHGGNEHFALMMFGYSKEEMTKMDIVKLFPEFYSHVDYSEISVQNEEMLLCEKGVPERDHNTSEPPSPSCDDLTNTQNSSVFHTVSEKSLNVEMDDIFGGYLDPAKKDDELLDLKQQLFGENQNGERHIHASSQTQPRSGGVPTSPTSRLVRSIVEEVVDMSTEGEYALSLEEVSMQEYTPLKQKRMPLCDNERRLSSTPRQEDKDPSLCSDEEETNTRHSQVASTPFVMKDLKSSLPTGEYLPQPEQEGEPRRLFDSLPDGFYSGSARHRDGTLIPVWFQLRRISLLDGSEILCMWVSKDYDLELSQGPGDLSLSRNTPKDFRYDQTVSPDLEAVPGALMPKGPAKGSNLDNPGEGEYDKAYQSVKQIGEGAFGFVVFAVRKDTGDMVVVKFLRKASILPDSWVKDESMGQVPLEISLLAKISHPHIVELIEAYENKNYFQMVMTKHGDGMDLFSFIDRCQMLTEGLSSYMFRQIVWALSYLHERNIIHRDVKDENIILDTNFHIKLIDFGSASLMEPGKLFSTFCGTLEYCSPEVLLGNKYAGPELEMWSLGVTLYTLVYGENPFHDVEETITGRLHPPFMTSPGLMKLLLWLLHPDPTSRATLADLKTDKWTNQPVNIEEYPFDLVMNGFPEDQIQRESDHKQNKKPFFRSASEGAPDY